MRRIKSGDQVIVITGKNKGSTGKVISVSGDGERVVVENVAVIKKHTRPNPMRGEAGGIVEREASIHASNVMHYNPLTKKADRVGFRVLEDGRKVRYFKSNDEVVDI
ncbi:MAG: 50S ribosomal protein L24 [Gammaproteobacteria bacterium]|nr:50S ribosomal protein L24 [Gammaproteobacteria bacterium]